MGEGIIATRNWTIIAHRGASGHAPENTLTAFEKALEIGVDGIEFDVRLTRDDQVVVIHDATLNRTTSLGGVVAKLTLEEIRRADAGIHFAPEFRGERVPTLQEALEFIPEKTLVFIEIKILEATLPAVRIAEEMNQTDRVVFISFMTEVLKSLHQHDSCLTTALLMSKPVFKHSAVKNAREMLTKARSVGTSALGVHWKIATPEFIQEIHRQGGNVWVWAVDDPKEIEKLVSAGVDGIASDYPDRVIAIGDRR